MSDLAIRLRTLADSSKLFAEATVDFRRLLDTVARRFSDLVGDGSYIRLVAEDGITLVPVATYHPDLQLLRFLRDYNERLPLAIGEGIAGKVVATGEVAFLPDAPPELFRARIKPEYAPVFDRMGITSLIVVPLSARGSNFGFVGLVRGAARPAYTPSDLQLARDLAERAALAIDNGRLLEKLERRVEQRTRTLESANRELEAFASSISHDLRGPLRAIDGYSKILDEDHGAQLAPAARELLDAIHASTRGMTRLVDDLLRLSRTSHRKIEPIGRVDMRALVDNALASLRTTHRRELAVTIGELPAAAGNHELLLHVWTNLLDNAIKFSRGEIRIEVSGRSERGELQYHVRDHGIGFDPADTEELFTVFRRLHDDVDGNGIGLALVKRIVTAHGGRVWAEGRSGSGATFSFALPDRPIGL